LLCWPGCMVTEGALGPPLETQELEALGVSVPVAGRMYACLRSPAMGDAKVPDIAQLVHQWLLRRRGLMPSDEWMQYGRPSPAGRVWQGVYIDDKVLLAVLRRAHREADLQEAKALVMQTEKAYADEGLTRHAGKEVRGAASATIWGTFVDGPCRRVRSDAMKLGQVVAVTAAAIAAGRCSGRGLRRLAGLWVHHLLPRRDYLCILDGIFRCAERLPLGRVATLDGRAVDELLLCCMLAGEAQTPLDAPWSPLVVATDASLHHGAVVEAATSLEEVAWLWSRASRRGCYTNLTWRPEANPTGDLVPADDLMHDWVTAVQFQEVVAYEFKKKEHINMLEMHAHKTWARRAAKDPRCWRKRHARLLDSGVCVGAIGRGRSSSFQLNRVLRSTLPHTGPTEILSGAVWTASKDNVADDPTRGRPVRQAATMDPEVRDRVVRAGARFEQNIAASHDLLVRRGERGGAPIQRVAAAGARQVVQCSVGWHDSMSEGGVRRALERDFCPLPLVGAKQLVIGIDSATGRLTRATWTSWRRARAMFRWVARQVPSHVRFSQVAIGFNLRMDRHVDLGAVGDVWVLHFGDFDGGAWMIGESTIDQRDSFVQVPAGVAHHVAPFTGPRWSVVAWLPTVTALVAAGPQQAVLRRLGARLTVEAPGCVARPRPGRRLRFLEVFSGVGVLSDTMRSLGAQVLDPLDIKHGPSGDVLRSDVLQGILDAIANREVDWIHLGTPCTTFCMFFVLFHKLCTRSSTRPAGDCLFDREVIGNRLLAITVQIITACMKHGVWWTVENPRRSLVWAMPGFVEVLREPGVVHAFMVYCRFGCQFQKQSRFSGTVPGLASLSCKCSRDHTHVRVQGRMEFEGKQRAVSEIAAQYPKPLCLALGWLAMAAHDANCGAAVRAGRGRAA
jgi:hypothetical protein